jgi:hypothetical protein
VKCVVLVLVACSGGSDEPVPPPQSRDAAIDAPAAEPVPLPANGMHVDDDVPSKPPTNAAKHAGHAIDIVLRSTPRSRALVDGMFVGKTPTLWSGSADGMPHVFTFVYDPPSKTAQRYAVAQYKFIPVASGVIHAKLEPIASDTDPASSPPP